MADSINHPKLELLAPAGSWDALTAAVDNGADAVYLGTRDFNARINARNFSLEELGKVVAFCHQHGVRVYLTMNTLVKNQELHRFFETMDRAYQLGTDGIIVQHYSFVDIIKASFSALKVFISTQGAIGNRSSASLFKNADRIILPRELSLAEIKEIAASGIGVEVFVHGALCFSYSGLCLFSSFVGSRSGNRGSCAQLCRQKFNGAYPLSTKELCTVRRIPQLIEAGVTGFKIEGRMRSPLYVAVATRLYRKAIDSYYEGGFEVPAREADDIQVVFNREFTEGMAFGETRIISPEKPMNRGAFLGKVHDGGIVLERALAAGDGVGIWSGETVTGAVVRSLRVGGKNTAAAVAREKVGLGLDLKDGDRVYLTSSAAISISPDFVRSIEPIPVHRRRPVRVILPRIRRSPARALMIMVKAYSLGEAREAAEAGAEVVFYDIFAPDFPGEGQRCAKPGIGAYLPRIMSEAELEQAVAWLKTKKPAAILTGNLGLLAHRGEFDAPIYLDYSLNAFNDLDLLFFSRYRATPVLSPELSLTELARFKDQDAVILVHGDIVLVNTRIEIQARSLRDDKGLVFPVRREGGYWQVLNSRPFGVFNDIRKLRDMGFREFLIDREGQAPACVRSYREMLAREVPDRRLRKGYTSGHLYRPVG